MRLAHLLVAPLALMAVPALAVVTPFGGGSTGTDPLGGAWTTTAQHWGEPGYLAGTITFNPGATTGNGFQTYATSFSFTFLKGVSGAIDQTPSPTPFGGGIETRFTNVTDNTAWLVSFDGKTVTFTAPTMASKLDAGDTFFVNVHFTGNIDASKFSFAGLWDEDPVAPAVPEPASWAMMIGGLALVGASMRRRKTIVSFA